MFYYIVGALVAIFTWMIIERVVYGEFFPDIFLKDSTKDGKRRHVISIIQGMLLLFGGILLIIFLFWLKK